MRFDVAIGNLVSIFDTREDYRNFLHAMESIAKTVKFLSPEEWLNIAIQHENIRKYVEHHYCFAYDSEYFINQIKQIIKKSEGSDKIMSDSATLLILISKQLIVVSEKLSILSEKVDTIINTDDIADEISEKIIEALDVDNLF